MTKVYTQSYNFLTAHNLSILLLPLTPLISYSNPNPYWAFPNTFCWVDHCSYGECSSASCLKINPDIHIFLVDIDSPFVIVFCLSLSSPLSMTCKILHKSVSSYLQTCLQLLCSSSLLSQSNFNFLNAPYSILITTK